MTSGDAAPVTAALEALAKGLEGLAAMGAVLAHHDEQSELDNGQPLEPWVVLALHAGVEGFASLMLWEVESALARLQVEREGLG